MPTIPLKDFTTFDGLIKLMEKDERKENLTITPSGLAPQDTATFSHYASALENESVMGLRFYYERPGYNGLVAVIGLKNMILRLEDSAGRENSIYCPADFYYINQEHLSLLKTYNDGARENGSKDIIDFMQYLAKEKLLSAFISESHITSGDYTKSRSSKGR